VAGEDAANRAVVGPGELDDERPHVGVVGPRPVNLVGGQIDGLAGGDPIRSSPTAVQPPPSITMKYVVLGFEWGSIRPAPVERELGHDAASVAVDDLAADALRARGATGPAVADPEPADLDRHRATRELSGGAWRGARSSAGSSVSGRENFVFV
jgi:hypothetical protein